MTVEQKPELNRFVDPSFTWTLRWQRYKTALPLVSFIYICMVEIVVIDGWLTEKPILDLVAPMIVSVTFSFLIIWGVLELQIFYYHRCKRELRIEDDKIFFRSGDRFSLRWKLVKQFQFEPVADAPGLTKLRVRGFTADWPRRERQLCAVIIERPAQVPELIQCLETKRTAPKADFEIRILEKPAEPPPTKHFSFLGRSLNLGGVYVLLHGIPLLCVALGLGHWHRDETSQTVSTARVAWEYFVLRHFSSVAQLRDCLLWLGVSLTISGAVLFILGWRLMNQHAQAESHRV